MSAQPEKRYFNVNEYYLMAQVGVLTPDDRVELIDGEILKMSPIGSPHAACVSRLDDLLRRSQKTGFMVRIQNPVRLNEFSEPVPDVVLLNPKEDYYAEGHPTPSDVLLIIEVAETSVLSDRRVKLPLYARHEIPEVWLISLPKKLVEQHFEVGNGSYGKLRKRRLEDAIVSTSVPGLSLKISDILG